MKKSFKDESREGDDAAAAETTPLADETSLAEIEGTGALVPADAAISLALGQVSGSVDQKDLIIPRLELVQGVGPLSLEYNAGELVLNKDTVVAVKDTPVTLIVLSIKKSYEEVLKYDANGPRPKTWETHEAVVADGLHTDWKNNQPPPVRGVAQILTLVEKPEGLESVNFNLEFEGKHYGLAVWMCRSTAYSRAAKKIFSASTMQLQHSGLLSGSWTLVVHRETLNGNVVSVPALSLNNVKNSPELIKFITDQFA